MTQLQRHRSCSLSRTQSICMSSSKNSMPRRNLAALRIQHASSHVPLSRALKNRLKLQLHRLLNMATGYSSTIFILLRIGCLFSRILCLNGKLRKITPTCIRGSECGSPVYQQLRSQPISFNHRSKWPFNHQGKSNIIPIECIIFLIYSSIK